MASAIFRGGWRSGPAILSARFVEKSPCSGCCGRATSISGMSTASSAVGSAPLSKARSSAEPRRA
jgi:hypothetical protein